MRAPSPSPWRCRRGGRYGLDVLAGDIADHPGNQDVFVVVASHGIPPPTATTARPWPCSSGPTNRAA